jgi:hypothetical protein
MNDDIQTLRHAVLESVRKITKSSAGVVGVVVTPELKVDFPE